MIATDKAYNFRPFSPDTKDEEKQEHQLTQVSTTKVGIDAADLFISDATNHSSSPSKSKSRSSGKDKSKSRNVKEDGTELESNSNKVSSPNKALNEFPTFPDPFAQSWHECSKDSNPKSPTRTVSRIVRPSNQTKLIVTDEKESQNSDKTSSSPKDERKHSKHSSPRKEKRQEGTSPTKHHHTSKDEKKRQKSASKIEDKENRRTEERRRSKSGNDDGEGKKRNCDEDKHDSHNTTQKEKRKHGDGERSKSMYHKSRNEKFDNQEVAEFLNIIESLAISADSNHSPVVIEKNREKESDKTRRDSRRLSGDNHKKKESKDHKDSSSRKESHKNSRRGSGETKDDDNKTSKSSRKEGNEDNHKRSKEKGSEKSNPKADNKDEKSSKGHKGSSTKLDSPEIDKKRKDDQSQEKLKKVLEGSSHEKSSSKKDGYGLQYFLKEVEKGETPKQSDEQSVRSRRSSIAAWREQSKSRSEKDKEDGSRRQLLPSRGSRKAKDEKKEGKDNKDKDKESDSDEDEDEEIDEEAKKEEERNRILLESRIGPVRALSRRRNEVDDTESLLSSLPLESELDQMIKQATGGGYLPAGLGAPGGQNTGLNQNNVQRDPSRSRRQSILCAADFSERSESNDDDLLTPAVGPHPNGKKGNINGAVAFDSSFSSLNSSFRKSEKFNAAGLRTSLAIATSPPKSAQRAKTAPSSSSQDGDDAIQNILKSRRLRGDNNVAPRAVRAEAEDTKKKTKKFSFV